MTTTKPTILNPNFPTSHRDRRGVERAIRSVEEEVTHLYSRLAVVTKEAEEAREKLASALAKGLSQWSENPSAFTPRSSITRRGRGDRVGVKKNDNGDEEEDGKEEEQEEVEEEEEEDREVN